MIVNEWGLVLFSTLFRAKEHVCSVLFSTSVPCYLALMFSGIQHSYSAGTIKWVPFTATSCSVLYRTFRYLLYPSYSLLLVYAGNHLYDVYMKNEQYEHESNQLRY